MVARQIFSVSSRVVQNDWLLCWKWYYLGYWWLLEILNWATWTENVSSNKYFIVYFIVFHEENRVFLLAQMGSLIFTRFWLLADSAKPLSLWISAKLSNLRNPSWVLKKKGKSHSNSCISWYLTYSKMPFPGACQCLPVGPGLYGSENGISRGQNDDKPWETRNHQHHQLWANLFSDKAVFTVYILDLDQSPTWTVKQEIWRSPVRGNADIPAF